MPLNFGGPGHLLASRRLERFLIALDAQPASQKKPTWIGLN
jgi:hypothetical protein